MKKGLLSLFIAITAFLVNFTGVQAGTNLTATCSDNGPCVIAPAATPLFNESGVYPGETRTQSLTVVNNDLNESCALQLSVTDRTTGQAVNLAPRMFAGIVSGSTSYFGSVSSGQAQPGTTYQDLFTAGTVSLGSLAPSSAQTFNWYASFDPTAGNEYQGVQTVFDLGLNLTCGTPPTPSPSPTSGGGGGSGSNGGGGGSGTVSTPVCTEPAPSAVQNLRITNAGTNTVTLAWNPATPVTNYALVFTRVSDGAQYGSTNIGNVTSYTVNNLSGGDSYSFEVFGVNNCAPGGRSNVVTTGTIAGAFIDARPIGGDGTVLGAQTEASPEPSAQATPSAEPSVLGQVAGATIEACAAGKEFIPWIILVIQLLAVLGGELYFRRSTTRTKHLLTLGATALSIIVFYLIRECDCYGKMSFLAWLCKWYWVVSILVTAVVRAISYAFIEEAELDKPKAKPATLSTTPKEETKE